MSSAHSLVAIFSVAALTSPLDRCMPGSAKTDASAVASASAAPPSASAKEASGPPKDASIFGTYRMVANQNVKTGARQDFTKGAEIIWEVRADTFTFGIIDFGHGDAKNVGAPVFAVCRAFATVPAVWHGKRLAIPDLKVIGYANAVIVAEHPHAKNTESPREISDRQRKCEVDITAMEVELAPDKGHGISLVAANELGRYELTARKPVEPFDVDKMVETTLGPAVRKH